MDNGSFWAITYASVLSWQYHPGCKDKLSLDEVALIADYALDRYVERRRLWDLQLPASPALL